ncbi:MAG: Pantothenate kinase type III, CoaX-like, partial [uncultured Acidimicrobiales bacterium]
VDRRRRRQHPHRRRPVRRRRAGRPLADRHQRRPHVRRARPAHVPVPGPARRGLRPGQRHGGLVHRPPAHRRAPHPGRAVPAGGARGPRARHPQRPAHPVREPPPGRPRPHRQRGGRLGPLRRADDHGGLRHRHHGRRHLGQGRVPGRRHPPRHRDQPRRPVRPGRGALLGGAGQAPPGDRQDHRRVGAVGRALRVRVGSRRAGDPLPGRARPVHGGVHRRPGRAALPADHHHRPPRALVDTSWSEADPRYEHVV